MSAVTDKLFEYLSARRPNRVMRVGIMLPTRTETAEVIRKSTLEGWMIPVLLGDERECNLFESLAALQNRAERIVAESSNDALIRAIEDGRIDVLLRGESGIHTMLKRLLQCREFRMGWLSQVALLYPPKLERLLLLSDAAITLSPTLEQKVKIVENALTVARKLQIETPKVALLAAVETVSTGIEVGMHDAILAKMSERGQFGKALLDGPLALDLALKEEAVKKKKVKSSVAGQADVLIAPNLEVGNGLYKAMITLAGAASASVVIGGSVPIALPSRSDHQTALVASLTLASILA